MWDIYKAQCKETHKIVAIKVVDKNALSRKERQHLPRKVESLKKLCGHPNIVKLLDDFED